MGRGSLEPLVSCKGGSGEVTSEESRTTNSGTDPFDKLRVDQAGTLYEAIRLDKQSHHCKVLNT